MEEVLVSKQLYTIVHMHLQKNKKKKITDVNNFFFFYLLLPKPKYPKIARVKSGLGY